MIDDLFYKISKVLKLIMHKFARAFVTYNFKIFLCELGVFSDQAVHSFQLK